MIEAAQSEIAIGFATALGVGLLIGIERERRKGSGATRMFAGVRTFAIASLCGALAIAVGIPSLAVAILCAVGLLAAIAHWRDKSQDPGITTEVALLATVLIGMLSMSRPGWAAAVATALVALLYLRDATQRFATHVLSEKELGDGIVLAALALILLPLLPDRILSDSIPFNPYRAMRLVILMSLVQALGYVALRLLGDRVGMPLAGLASGFISSTATHGAMAARAKETPEHASAALSAATLSNVATGFQAGFVIFAIAPSALPLLAPYLIAMIAAAGVAGAIAFRRIEAVGTVPQGARPFSLKQSFIFAGLLTAVTAITIWLQREWGASAALVASALAALIDVHVSIASILTASLGNRMDDDALILPFLICLTVNALTKAVVSVSIAGRSAYSASILGALGFLAAAPWVVWVLR